MSERTVSRILRRSGSAQALRVRSDRRGSGRPVPRPFGYVAGPSRRTRPHRRQEAGAHSKGQQFARPGLSAVQDHRSKGRRTWFMTTSTPWSTITHASPIQKSSTTRPPGRAAQDSSPGPQLHFGAVGLLGIEEVMTDNAKNYTRSRLFQEAITELGASHLLIRPHCPWQNGKVEAQPHSLDRVGLPASLQVKCPTHPCSGNMAPALRHQAPRACSWGTTASQLSCHQPACPSTPGWDYGAVQRSLLRLPSRLMVPVHLSSSCSRLVN